MMVLTLSRSFDSYSFAYEKIKLFEKQAIVSAFSATYFHFVKKPDKTFGLTTSP